MLWIKYIELTCLGVKNFRTGDDPGCCLELYGLLNGATCRYDNRGQEITEANELFWKRESNNTISLDDGAAETLNVKKTLVLFPGKHIKFGGLIIEEDQDFLNPDDSLGTNYLRFDYDYFQTVNAPEIHEITFTDNGGNPQVAMAWWKVEYVTLIPIPGT
ncbi:hypothetical protein [Bacillus paramycoides]|uniref:hypothetical protein n=1 Tax=Bacillus paramycoides TaxID=2026194 RepID=UPI002E2082E2|nr:hypothetical protein [Bacillus paramycoides]